MLPLTISKNILNNKVNIVEELCNDHLRGNVPNILGAMLAKHHIRVKAFEDN